MGKEGGCSECSGCPIFAFFIKENWICAMTRHRVEANINIILTRNISFDQAVKPSFNDVVTFFVG